MKKKYLNVYGLIGVLFLAQFFVSCNYLDVDQYFDDTLTLDSAFTKRNYTEYFLSNAYEVMYDEVCDFATGGKGGYALFASDELLRMDDGQLTKKYQNGEYSATQHLTNDKWYRVYETVRKASTFIQLVDKCEEMTLNERSERKAEARFLRGYAYWTLLTQYGPVPILPDEGFDLSMTYNQMATQRNTFEECVDFIANDFLLAARNLPLVQPSNNIGRPTRGAALAARARLYLFAASPLYNKQGNELFELVNYDGVQLVPQTYDEKKWAIAAAAALDVINLKSYELNIVGKSSTTVEPPTHPEFTNLDFPRGWANIDPYESYRQIFDGTISASKNKEIIFTRPNDRKNGIRDLISLMVPYNSSGGELKGKNSIAVTLKQVKAYYRHDGRTVEQVKEAGEYEYDNEPDQLKRFTTTINQFPFISRGVSYKFANLEPRFYASIAYPGSIWEFSSANETVFKNQQIFYYAGTYNGKQFMLPENYPVTGIGLKKYYNPEDALTNGGLVAEKFEPAIRYAEVLLWYAEALNELEGEHTVTLFNGEDVVIRRDVNAMQSGMKQVRLRAGLPDFDTSTYNNREAFRTALKRERQIEFFAESIRYFDLRRWKDAELEENMPIMGFNIDMNQTNAQKIKFYDEVLVSTYPKIFQPRMYLWPIPWYDIEKNHKLTQNPGW